MWLYLPSELAPCAPGMADSTSLSGLQCQALARCCTSRGRHMQPRYGDSAEAV